MEIETIYLVLASFDALMMLIGYIKQNASVVSFWGVLFLIKNN